jgi:hypothetical protein
VRQYQQARRSIGTQYLWRWIRYGGLRKAEPVQRSGIGRGGRGSHRTLMILEFAVLGPESKVRRVCRTEDAVTIRTRFPTVLP